MGLQPHEFEELQPHEFEELWEGYIWRKEQEENMQAYFTAAAMSVHTKEPIAPRQLLEPIRESLKQDKVDKKKEDEEYLLKLHKLGGET